MKLKTLTIALTLLIGALPGCSKQESIPMNITQIKADLEVLSRARVIFGHQSVGGNILAGLETLSKDAGVPLRIVPIQGLPPDDLPGFFHSEIGENGDPDSKCEIFSQLLTRPERPQYDLAMMKFCYVDLGRETPLEVAAMLKRYTQLVDHIAVQRPDVTLIHSTMPLHADPKSWKTPVKRLIGREEHTDADNILRNSFNDALRTKYPGPRLFDLAAVESSLPTGKRTAFEYDNRQIYTLAQEYTYDGGHLNEEGRRRAAAELIKVLAAELRRRQD